MPKFVIRTLNSAMTTVSELASYAHAEEALETGIRSATAMLSDEIHQGSRASAVEVAVEDPDGQAHHRVAVSLSVAPLIAD